MTTRSIVRLSPETFRADFDAAVNTFRALNHQVHVISAGCKTQEVVAFHSRTHGALVQWL